MTTQASDAVPVIVVTQEGRQPPAAKPETDRGGKVGAVAPTLSLDLTSKETLEYLADRAGQIAAKRATVGENVWRTFAALMLAGMAFFGITRLNDVEATLRSSVKQGVQDELSRTFDERFVRLENRLDKQSESVQQLVANAVAKELPDALKSYREELDQTADYIILLLGSQSIDLSNGFTRRERENLVAAVERLVKIPSIRARPEFPAALDRVLSSFHKAGQGDAVDRVVKSAPEVCYANSDIVTTLLEHYSRRILSASDRVEGRRLYEEYFKALAPAADRLGGQVFSLAMSVVVEFGLDGELAADLIGRQLDEVEALDPKDRLRVVGIVRGMTDPKNLSKTGTDIDSKRVSEAARGFVAAHKQRLDRITASASAEKGSD